LEKQYVKDALDLHLVEETARYVYRIIAAKIMFQDPTRFGFELKASQLYQPIPYREIVIDFEISNLAEWALKHGTTYSMLKIMNPWLRQDFLQNKSRRTYILQIPKEERLHYFPEKVVPHDNNWVVE